VSKRRELMDTLSTLDTAIKDESQFGLIEIKLNRAEISKMLSRFVNGIKRIRGVV
jgi:hypothetical protein